MSLTISLTLLKRKKRKDGKIPIYIRLTENRKSRYKSTGIAVKKSEWNANKNKVNTTHRRYKHLNIELETQLNNILDVKKELYKLDKLSMVGILNELSDDTDTRSILHQAKEYKKHLQKEERYWRQRHFSVVINNLTAFINHGKHGHSDRLGDLDSDWIEAFQNYLIDIVENGNNTVGKKMIRLKGFTTWLLKNNEIDSDPFTTVDRVKRNRSTIKTKLALQQIHDIENLDLPYDSALWHTRNYFMYSFYNAGIRFGDLCCLKWSNLIDGRLTYSMNKTGGQKSIQQLEPMEDILALYGQKNRDIFFRY